MPAYNNLNNMGNNLVLINQYSIDKPPRSSPIPNKLRAASITLQPYKYY